MTPKISIVIPLYNKSNAISKTITSALQQTFTNFELIIVNDGSTDNSLDIVNSINDDRIKIYNTKNKGVSAARNFGIAKSSSNYIAFLDADDIWLPNHLDNLNTLLNNYPDCGLYCTAYEKHFTNIVSPAVFNSIPNKKDGFLQSLTYR